MTIIKHQYKVSVERLNPIGPYSRKNIVLIVCGLNSPLVGQYLNRKITDKTEIIQKAKFNQKYWNKCTLVDKERSEIIRKVVKTDENRLQCIMRYPVF